MSYKLGKVDEGSDSEFKYGDIFHHERFPEWSRVTFAPDKNQIPIMLEIAKRWQGSFGILWVLTVSRTGQHKPGRYQSPEPCTFDDLELFAYRFQEFFEWDGRHHLWFMDVSGGAQLIYDNHNLIYSYGNDEDVIELLKSKGFTARAPEIPAPHSHRYNQEFDASEDEVMKYFNWKWFPLQDEHDDP